ncbi:uncharacterized protein LOC121877212 isoform X2 [Homarus americanus]|uniref:uncharacterized protein LOC121877212 isoform X2 n=1 Tax=Homarus americanus TaxID=6706 RepID=UPI001C461B01|nr:uncharacterized protein LOC121877212 isoform X2 [Homarus americanus]
MANNHQWEAVNRVLRGLQLPEGPTADLWRSFVVELYNKVEQWEEVERRRYRHSQWDFGVIHTKHPGDLEIVDSFRRLVEHTLGITGRSLADVELGDNTLAEASRMVENSNKVFILASKHLNRPGVHKFIFQDALMTEVLQDRWRSKIIPLKVPGEPRAVIFGLNNIEGLTLGNDPRTLQLVSNAISLEEQMEVRRERQRDEERHRNRILRQRTERLQQIREVVEGLRQEFGDDYDPTEQLQQLRLVAEDYMDGGVDQVINMSGCSNVTVGPSYHFAVSRATPSALTPHHTDHLPYTP